MLDDFGDHANLQPLSLGHTYSTDWEVFQNGRAVVLNAGTYDFGMQFACSNTGFLNGAGMQGYYVRYGE